MNKIRRALLLRLKALGFRIFSRKVTCYRCGQPLGKALPLMHDGNIRVHGIEGINVFVDFETINTVRFRHTNLSCCRPSTEDLGNAS